MSVDGRRALQGFSYQGYIALQWIIELIHDDRDDPIEKISVDSVGFLDAEKMPEVDDIVVRFKSNETMYIQAKKNQTDRKAWSLTDSVLRKELCSARDQLQEDESSTVRFYSRDPFGELQKLADACRSDYPNYEVFESEAPDTLAEPLIRLANTLDVTEEETFSLIQRIEFEVTHDFERLERDLHRQLSSVVTNATVGLALLRQFLQKHSTGQLSASRHEVVRENVVQYLEENGVLVTPDRSVQEILDAFDSASQIGRSWSRKIDGEHVQRKEVETLLDKARGGADTVLVKGRPGSGKTCVLLDLVDRLEKYPDLACLFIKGDRFCDISSAADLSAEGLPDDIPGQCARLAQERNVVVVIDALDVLSLNRHHKALKVFLGVIERLSRVGDVTVVAACRTFDLKYDPQLRGVEWDAEVTVDLLDFESQVIPFLEKWNVSPESVAEPLQEAICIPQNLNLYAQVAKKSRVRGLASVYQLQDRFLDEVIVKDEDLGDSALQGLQKMAATLINERSHSIPKTQFDGSEAIVQRLVSQEVLSEPEEGKLEFAHQTLGDNLATRMSIAQGKTLQQFIRNHPPFPFIRPSVRSFLFYLRSREHKRFRKEIWQVLSDKDIAYHLRRLVAESLSELNPTQEDWPLIRRLYNRHSDLFRRFFDRVATPEWVELLRDRWLPKALRESGPTPWGLLFLEKLYVLCPGRTDEAVAQYQRAINEEWEDKEEVAASIVSSIREADSLDGETAQLKNLFSQIVRVLNSDHHIFEYRLGSIISKWIDKTGEGDGVLWSYITKDVTIDDSTHIPTLGLQSDLYLNFHRDDFLVDRLSKSNDFISTAIKGIRSWSSTSKSSDTESSPRRGYLSFTSWNDRRTDNDINSSASLSLLFTKIERALRNRCRQNDDWWQENEPRLRSTLDLAFRYLTIQAYQYNLEDNLDGVREQIFDADLYLQSDFHHEIGCLIQEAYPLLTRTDRTKNQELLLEIKDRSGGGDSGDSSRRIKIIYDCLNRIPRCYRKSQTQDFLDEWEPTFGRYRSQPAVRSWVGAVRSPVSIDSLLRLSTKALIRLLNYFDGVDRSVREKGGRIVGGCEQLGSTLREAASMDPARYVKLLPKLRTAGVDAMYVQSLYRGVGRYVQNRCGNLNPDADWKPLRPLPSQEWVAWELLRITETCSQLWDDNHSAKRVVEACSDVVQDTEYASRLIILIYRLLRCDERHTSEIDSAEEAKQAALNRSQAVATNSAISVFYEIHSWGEEQPELAEPLLRRCATHSDLSVRAAVLMRLPYLVQEKPGLGWELFHLTMQGVPAFLWPLTEQVLYHNYYEDFSRVEGYLNRMKKEAIDEAGDTYGRILTLSYLAEHVSEDDLFEEIREANDDVRRGAAQVLSSNLTEKRGKCISGLRRMLRTEDLTVDTWSIIVSRSLVEEKRDRVTKELIREIIRALPSGGDRGDFYQLADWIAEKSQTDPHAALGVAETLIDCVEENEQVRYGLQSKVMAEAFLNILREADEFGDENLAHRALTLQDRLLKLNFSRVDKMIDDASREW